LSRIIELFDKNPGYQERHLILNFIKRLLIISINNPKLDQDPITNLIVKILKNNNNKIANYKSKNRSKIQVKTKINFKAKIYEFHFFSFLYGRI